jgi:hypothetical protein
VPRSAGGSEDEAGRADPATESVQRLASGYVIDQREGTFTP